jgi:stage II sporulation protein M
MRLLGWIQQFRPMKHYLIAAIFVFVSGVILGYADSAAFHNLVHAQMDQLQGMANKIKQSDHRQWSLFTQIYLNNMLASVMAILLGSFFGILPLYFLVSNGLMVGYLAANRPDGQTMLYFLKGILPHGIIEIPAFVLACSIGLRLGFLVLESFGSLLNQERRAQFQIKFRTYLKQLVPMMILVAGLMLLAAVIESTITYNLMK